MGKECDNMKEAIITAKGICRSFALQNGEKVKVLKGIDLSVQKGKLTVLKGRSGSGKTTLLNILSGLDMPDSGEVEILGKSLQGWSEEEKECFRRKEMGFVFQSVALLPMMTAYENIDFGLRMAGIWMQEGETAAERINSLLEQLGLKKRSAHLPEQMSGGERQRIAIARAIVHRPKILWADEPTGALDTVTGLAMMQLFRQLVHDEGLSIVMTTHDPNLMELADEVYEIEDGEIIGRDERIYSM